jgi:hypothetical protein
MVAIFSLFLPSRVSRFAPGREKRHQIEGLFDYFHAYNLRRQQSQEVAVCPLKIPKEIAARITTSARWAVKDGAAYSIHVFALIPAEKGQLESSLVLNCLEENVVVTMHGNPSQTTAAKGAKNPFSAPPAVQ